MWTPLIATVNGVSMSSIPSSLTKREIGFNPPLNQNMGSTQPENLGWIKPNPRGPRTKCMAGVESATQPLVDLFDVLPCCSKINTSSPSLSLSAQKRQHTRRSGIQVDGLVPPCIHHSAHFSATTAVQTPPPGFGASVSPWRPCLHKIL
jgi:hypothetical protein